MNNRTLIHVVFVGLLLGVAVPAAAQTGSSRLVGIVEFVQGDVSIDGRPADFGQEVPLGAWVQCGPSSRVDIVFDSVNVFRLGENTVAEINIGRERQDISLRFGTLAAVFDRVRKIGGQEAIRVRTPTAVGAVRGTAFFYKVINSTETYVCTCNGTIEWDDTHGDHPFTVSAPNHEAYLFTDTGDGIAVTQSELLYHSSDALDDVAAVVDITVPWGSLE